MKRTLATRFASIFLMSGLIFVTSASAQNAPNTQPNVAPKRPPSAAAAKPGGGGPVKPREVSGVTLGWVRHCAEVGAELALACVTQQEVRDPTGEFIASLAYQEPAGGARKRLAIGVPLGTWLPSELSIRIDQGKRVEARYGTCLNNGCFAAVDVTPTLYQQLRSGEFLVITLHDAFDRPVDVKLPLETFVKAVDGSPANIAESEEIHKQWVGSLNARAQAQAKQGLAPPAAEVTSPDTQAPASTAPAKN